MVLKRVKTWSKVQKKVVIDKKAVKDTTPKAVGKTTKKNATANPKEER